MKEVRRYWLNELLNDRFAGEQKRLVAASGLSKGMISLHLAKGFGDGAVQTILEGLADNGYKLQADYFDRPIPTDGAAATVTSITAKQMPVIEAFEVFAATIRKLPPDKRRRVIDATAAYAADPTEEAEHKYVLDVLSGGAPIKQAQRKQANQR